MNAISPRRFAPIAAAALALVAPGFFTGSLEAGPRIETDVIPLLRTTTGHLYRQVEFLQLDADGPIFRHAQGMAKIPLSELSAEMQTQLGYPFFHVGYAERSRRAKKPIEDQADAVGDPAAAVEASAQQTSPASPRQPMVTVKKSNRVTAGKESDESAAAAAATAMTLVPVRITTRWYHLNPDQAPLPCSRPSYLPGPGHQPRPPFGWNGLHPAHWNDALSVYGYRHLAELDLLVTSGVLRAPGYPYQQWYW